MCVWFSLFIIAFPCAFIYFQAVTLIRLKKWYRNIWFRLLDQYLSQTTGIADINVSMCFDFSIVCWWMRVELAALLVCTWNFNAQSTHLRRSDWSLNQTCCDIWIIINTFFFVYEFLTMYTHALFKICWTSLYLFYDVTQLPICSICLGFECSLQEVFGECNYVIKTNIS
jgi:hypothetical protein